MINDMKKAPYIREIFGISRSLFLNQITPGTVIAKGLPALGGHNAGLEINEAIKPMIGEFIERQSLYYNYKKPNDYMKAFRLVNGKGTSFPARNIVFVKDGNFADSCGVASHLNSKETIENAFLEFFERQSFIYNWLNKSKGRIIKIDYFNTRTIVKYHNVLMNFVDDIFLFEISLDPIIKVVFGLGIGVHHKAIGLSAAFSIEEAIASTLQEMVQGISHRYNKKSVYYYDENMSFDDEDIHIKNFDKYNPEQLLAEYSYLFKDNESYEDTKDIPAQELTSIVNTLEARFGIKIYCSLIPCFYKGFRTKIVKVFSPEGFPHMSPPDFIHIGELEIYGNKVNESLNFNRAIPFP